MYSSGLFTRYYGNLIIITASVAQKVMSICGGNLQQNSVKYGYTTSAILEKKTNATRLSATLLWRKLKCIYIYICINLSCWQHAGWNPLALEYPPASPNCFRSKIVFIPQYNWFHHTVIRIIHIFPWYKQLHYKISTLIIFYIILLYECYYKTE